MKKPANRTKDKDKFTVTEVGTLVEGLRSEFRIFGEDLISVKSDVTSIKEIVGQHTEDIALLKIAVREMVASIKILTDDMILVKAAIKEMAADIKMLTKSIDGLVRTKADREDIHVLEKRIAALETKVATLSR